MRNHPTSEEILGLYDYDRERGLFLRKSEFRRWQPGQIAGTSSAKGRSVAFLLPDGRRKSYSSKLLIWFLEKGEWPRNFVIHIDGDKFNDRIENLSCLPHDPENATVDDLWEAFHYEPTSGAFYRKMAFKQARVGKIIDTNNEGYSVVAWYGKSLLVHRVVWKMVHGEWPNYIDHINGVRNDNRLCNLRNVTMRTNARNVRKTDNTATGVMGVYTNPTGKPYRARISVDGKMLNLGSFDTLESAAAARKRADAKYGYHPNHGRDAEERAKTT